MKDCAPGSSLCEIYFWNCVLSLNANVFIFGCTCTLVVLWCNKSGFNNHSLLGHSVLVFLTALMLVLPEMCSADTKMFLSIHHFQMFIANVFHGDEWLVSIWLTAATAVVLSVRNFICLLNLSHTSGWIKEGLLLILGNLYPNQFYVVTVVVPRTPSNPSMNGSVFIVI